MKRKIILFILFTWLWLAVWFALMPEDLSTEAVLACVGAFIVSDLFVFALIYKKYGR